MPASCGSRRPFACREHRLGRRTLGSIVNPSVDRMQPEYGWRAVSGGVDAAGNQWLAYSGMTLAPWSSNIYSDGWHCASVEAMGNIRMIGVPIAVTAAHSRLQLAATVRNVSASIILTPRRWSATTSGSAS